MPMLVCKSAVVAEVYQSQKVQADYVTFDDREIGGNFKVTFPRPHELHLGDAVALELVVRGSNGRGGQSYQYRSGSITRLKA